MNLRYLPKTVFCFRSGLLMLAFVLAFSINLAPFGAGSTPVVCAAVFQDDAGEVVAEAEPAQAVADENLEAPETKGLDQLIDEKFGDATG